MKTADKIKALLDDYKDDIIDLNNWELDFLTNISDKLEENFTEKQIEKVDEIWDKKYDN
jgi:subtilisin-like proprotein convertase family protein